MRVLFIYRHPAMGYSIGKVFKPLEKEMKKYAEVDSVYLPRSNYSPWGLFSNILKARRAASEKHYDIVHITGAEHYLIPFIKKQNVVVTVHDIGFCTILKHGLTYPIKYLLFVKSLKLADFVTFISEKSRLEAKRFVKLDGSKCVIISNAVGEGFRPSKKAFNERCPIILHVGTLERKNINRTIEALNGIPCNLHVVGAISSNQRKRIEELCIDYVVREKLTDREIEAEYSQCDIVNFPSLYEGFGMPIIEGQASGKLVITSNREPMLSVAGKGGAYIVNPEDVSSIHNAYINVINDKDKREEIIAKGIENAQKYSVQRITKQYYSLYLKIAHNH